MFFSLELEMKLGRCGVLVFKGLDLSTYRDTENVSRVFQLLWYKSSYSAALPQCLMS